MEVLRPTFLLWSLIDSLHQVIAAPSGSSYQPSQIASFLSSTSSSWFRRWGQRQSAFLSTQLSTFRSIMRREHDILDQLSHKVLQTYEAQSNEKDIQAIIRASPGVTDALAKEGLTIDQLLVKLTQSNDSH